MLHHRISQKLAYGRALAAAGDTAAARASLEDAAALAAERKVSEGCRSGDWGGGTARVRILRLQFRVYEFQYLVP